MSTIVTTLFMCTDVETTKMTIDQFMKTRVKGIDSYHTPCYSSDVSGTHTEATHTTCDRSSRLPFLPST